MATGASGVGRCVLFRIKQRNYEQSDSIVQLMVWASQALCTVPWSTSSLLYLRRASLGSFNVGIPTPDRGSFLLASFMWSFWYWWQKSLFSFSSVVQLISSQMSQPYSSVAFQPLLNMDFLLLIYILVLVEICRVTHKCSWDRSD